VILYCFHHVVPALIYLKVTKIVVYSLKAGLGIFNMFNGLNFQ